MSAPAATQPQAAGGRRGAVSDPVGRATAAAGAGLVGGLALAVGDVGGAALALAVTGAGAVAGLFVLGPAAGHAARRHRGLLVAGAVLVVGLIGLVVLTLGLGTRAGGGVAGGVYELVVLTFQLLPLLVVLAAAAGGLVLVADDLRARLGLGVRPRTPWQRLAGRADAGAAPAAWRGLTGLALIAFAALAGLLLAGIYLGGGGFLELLVLLLVAVVGLAVVGTPLLVAASVRADRGNTEGAREDERQRMAAHLHDSVLQTLALVQRQAHEPATVARLARRQEHDLRAWMAGEAELGSETLGAALRDAVAEVEDAHDAVVEVTVLGDRPLDRQGEALAAAAREALRNAARHAPGAPIFVFAQVGPAGVEVFVRDEGGGFDLARVPTERRGVRDAIVGRMAAAGGAATVESSADEGTEVALRLPEGRS
jgi:signal transduction histidine kinase